MPVIAVPRRRPRHRGRVKGPRPLDPDDVVENLALPQGLREGDRAGLQRCPETDPPMVGRRPLAVPAAGRDTDRQRKHRRGPVPGDGDMVVRCLGHDREVRAAVTGDRVRLHPRGESPRDDTTRTSRGRHDLAIRGQHVRRRVTPKRRVEDEAHRVSGLEVHLAGVPRHRQRDPLVQGVAGRGSGLRHRRDDTRDVRRSCAADTEPEHGDRDDGGQRGRPSGADGDPGRHYRAGADTVEGHDATDSRDAASASTSRRAKRYAPRRPASLVCGVSRPLSTMRTTVRAETPSRAAASAVVTSASVGIVAP